METLTHPARKGGRFVFRRSFGKLSRLPGGANKKPE